MCQSVDFSGTPEFPGTPNGWRSVISHARGQYRKRDAGEQASECFVP
jgi:hypothetical protein